MSVARWPLGLCLLAACAVSRPLAFEQRLAAGDRAFSSGRSAEAAAAYASAAETGGRVRDQDQAHHRARSSPPLPLRSAAGRLQASRALTPQPLVARRAILRC